MFRGVKTNDMIILISGKLMESNGVDVRITCNILHD